MKNELILRGGLGNQLFIFLEAIRLFKKYNDCPIILNLSNYNDPDRTDRPFALNKLLQNLEHYVVLKKGFFPLIRLWLVRVVSRFTKKRFDFDRLPGDDINNFILFPLRRIHYGYFQKVEGAESIKALQTLSRLYSLKSSLVNANNDSLAVHIRRGDYMLSNHSLHGILPIEDILIEVSYALKVDNFSSITIFSDSPDLIDIKMFVRLGLPINIDIGGDAVDVFNRMASFGGIIASNSTFSLWAGLLGFPKFFSIPECWMPNVSSNVIGFPWLRRYPCTLQ
jgi:hypothetical protein